MKIRSEILAVMGNEEMHTTNVQESLANNGYTRTYGTVRGHLSEMVKSGILTMERRGDPNITFYWNPLNRT